MVDVIESVIFCPHCQNILSPGKQDNDLIYSCRLCNYVQKSQVKNYRISYISMETTMREESGSNIVLDPTIPRIKKKCPNSKCKSEYAVYIVEPATLKKRYYCTICSKQITV
jgi:DNA-directed RNA polymerase subunit M/transcription elongation factor TFIIS